MTESKDGMDLLVIGASTHGGIGEDIAYTARFNKGMLVHAPSPEELDVTDDVETAKYIAEFGPYSHVVYCAGIQKLGKINELSIHDVRDVFDVNVIGFINVLQALVNTQQQGRVCAVSSLAGRTAMRGSIAYCASKAALNHAVRCAARELGSNWQITAVVPGTVADTPLTESVDQQVMRMRNWDHEELIKQERMRQPFGRRIYKNEVSFTVLSILLGAPTITGAIIDIAGGA